jgi:hypothetical protein
VEFELEALERNLWWSDVIARLEEDLHHASQPEQIPLQAPPPHAPSHRGGNLFDLLNEEMP